MDRWTLAPFAPLVCLIGVVACGGRVEDTAAAPPWLPSAGDPPAGTRPAKLASAEDASFTDPPRADVCPEKAPAADEWCPKPLARCTYPDRCSLKSKLDGDLAIYECVGSRWTRRGGEYEVECPATLPAAGSACEVDCRYPSPCSYTTACGTSRATCEPRSGTWWVAGPACGDAGAPDGG